MCGVFYLFMYFLAPATALRTVLMPTTEQRLLENGAVATSSTAAAADTLDEHTCRHLVRGGFHKHYSFHKYLWSTYFDPGMGEGTRMVTAIANIPF